MFFSILIPAYNCEEYIDSCISSIMSQSCQDFELLIANDGSKDRTMEKCKVWVEKFPQKVRLISKPNTGSYLTRRLLLREAKGEYFCFVDADDNYISNVVLEHIRNTIEHTNCDMCFFDATSNMKTMKKKFGYPYKNGEIFEGQRINEIYELFLNTKKFHHLWNKVFKKNLVDYETPDSPFNFRMLRDGVYQITPILSKARRIVYIDEILYFYRADNENSLSHNFNLDFYYSMVALNKRILECCKEWVYKNATTDNYVKANCTTDMCISAIKARDLPENSPINRIEYIKLISNEPLFRKQYTINYIANYRKPIAWALYHKHYWMVNIVSSLVGAIKRVMK